MQAAIWTGNHQFRLEERAVPTPDTDEVVIKVLYTGICGSDVIGTAPDLPVASKLATAKTGAGSTATIFGHEYSGTVAAVGSKVKQFKVGDRVVAHPAASCGVCAQCRDGRENLCSDLFFPMLNGVGGSFAGFTLNKEKQVYHIPDSLSFRHAALVEPVAIAVHAIDRAGIKSGDRVLIFGGGAIGQLLVQLASLAGAALVMLSEPVASKREVSLQTGADIVVDPTVDNLKDIVLCRTSGLGVDVCIEAAGVPALVQQGLDLLRAGGRMLLVGTPKPGQPIVFDGFTFFLRELEIRSAFFSPYSFQRAIQLMPRLQLDALITHTFPLQEINAAMALASSQQGIKILLQP